MYLIILLVLLILGIFAKFKYRTINEALMICSTILILGYMFALLMVLNDAKDFIDRYTNNQVYDIELTNKVIKEHRDVVNWKSPTTLFLGEFYSKEIAELDLLDYRYLEAK